MKYITILVSSMCLMGCGPEWNGTFVGKLTQSGTCSDGSPVPDIVSAVQVTLVDNGDSVTWEAGCGATVIADLNGNDSADVRQASCPAKTDADGITSSITIEGGTLELNDNTLRMELETFLTLSGTVSGTCELTADGTLNRLEE
jgi:hypothetical protein